MNSIFLSHADVYNGDYNCDKWYNNNEFNHGFHYHDFFEVQFYTSNAGTLVINDKEYVIKRGDVVMLNLFEPHMLIINPVTYQGRICIAFNANFLLSSCSENSNLLRIFNKSNSHYPIAHLSDENFDQYLSILQRFSNINMKHGRDILERSLLYELIAHLFDDFFDEQQTNPSDMQSIATIIKLVRYIDEHISEDLSLERLSAEVNFSKFYTCRVFKKYTGYTLNKYIVSKRIERSKALLNGPTSISDISKSSGFNNYSYFYKTFKKTYGVNPAEYKAACSEE